MEERYNDAQDVPGAVAGGGGDWKDAHHQAAAESTLKRARSPDDEGDSGRGVRIAMLFVLNCNSSMRRRIRVRRWRSKSMTQIVCESLGLVTFTFCNTLYHYPVVPHGVFVNHLVCYMFALEERHGSTIWSAEDLCYETTAARIVNLPP